MGGQIREVVSTGNGASVMGGAAGFLVGNLNIPGYEQPWEPHVPYPSKESYNDYLYYCTILVDGDDDIHSVITPRLSPNNSH